MKKQNGGTILGMIIGLVIGLGIAVTVAVMITKTPTPFTNKLGLTKANDLPPVQVTDPNKPLYGNAYKEAPQPVNNPVAEQPLPYVETAPQDDSDAEQASDAEKATSKSTTPDAKKPTDEKPAYYLQVGAFRSPSDAENARAKLALIGVEANVGHKNTEGDNLYRVRIGPFANLEEMNRMRSKLVENSIDVAVIRTPK